MARNKSEKLPRCPELHVYAKLCARMLENDATCGLNPEEWRRIPTLVKREVNNSFSAQDHSGRGHWHEWYAFVIAYAKANYGP